MTKVMNLMNLHFPFYIFNVHAWYLENTKYYDQNHEPTK